MLIEELYDALIEAGASEAKAKAAVRAIADYEKRFGGIERELASLRSEFRTELTEFRSDVETKFLELRSDMERKFLEFRSDMDKQFAGVDRQFAGVDKQFAESRAYVEKEFTDISGTLKLHNWMMGTTIALLTAMFLKMFY